MKPLYHLIIASVFASGCHSSGNTSNNRVDTLSTENKIQLSPAQFANANISVSYPESRDIFSPLELYGKIDVPPQNMISVSIPLGGYLQSTHLLPGSEVQKGEIIALVEDQQYIQLQQDYLTAREKLKFLKSESERQTVLNQNKAASDKVQEQASFDFRSQEIALKAIAEKLRLIHLDPDKITPGKLSRSIPVYSPIHGFVSKVNVNIGKYVNPSEILFELINPYDIHLNLKVFEKDLSSIHIGQTVLAYTNEMPEKKYECKVILVSKDLSADRTADIHCHFENYDKTLLPGTFMRAVIPIAARKEYCIPESAIVNFEGIDYVFAENSTALFEMLAVKTGPKSGGWVSIQGNDNLYKRKIATVNAYTILMAMKNKPE